MAAANQRKFRLVSTVLFLLLVLPAAYRQIHWHDQIFRGSDVWDDAPAAHASPANATSRLHTQNQNHSQTHTTDHERDVTICFVASVYGKWASQADQLQNVMKLDIFNSTNVHFLAVTNLPKLFGKGWTRIVKPLTQYTRHITQSRYGKFFAWNLTEVQQRQCEVIFYQDAIGHIIGNYSQFQAAARAILASEVGLAQYLHRGGNGAWGEFRRIEVFHKDSLERIQASKDWLLQQPGFDPNCTLYENRYFGYSVHSQAFRRASIEFWKHYSLEVDSWRDQPLWCYILDYLNIEPIPLHHKGLWTLKPRRMGNQGHKYIDKKGNDK